MIRCSIIIGIVVLMIIGCTTSSTDERPKVRIPSIKFRMEINGKPDSIRLSDFLIGDRYHVLIFIDGDCGGCVANLNGWKSFFDQTAKDFHSSLIVSTGSIRTFQGYYALLGLNRPVLYDPNHTIRKINGWSDDVILVDTSQCVLLKGNPITDLDIKRQYKRLLRQIRRHSKT